MLFGKYVKPVGANRFGACRAVGRNQLRPNVQNCFSPLSYVFNPLLYRLSYQAKTWNYNEFALSALDLGDLLHFMGCTPLANGGLALTFIARGINS